MGDDSLSGNKASLKRLPYGLRASGLVASHTEEQGQHSSAECAFGGAAGGMVFVKEPKGEVAKGGFLVLDDVAATVANVEGEGVRQYATLGKASNSCVESRSASFLSGSAIGASVASVAACSM